MFSKQTQSKIVFAIAVTLFFILFRIPLFTKLLDKILGGGGYLTKEGNDVSMVGNIVLTSLFFVAVLVSSLVIM